MLRGDRPRDPEVKPAVPGVDAGAALVCWDWPDPLRSASLLPRLGSTGVDSPSALPDCGPALSPAWRCNRRSEPVFEYGFSGSLLGGSPVKAGGTGTDLPVSLMDWGTAVDCNEGCDEAEALSFRYGCDTSAPGHPPVIVGTAGASRDASLIAWAPICDGGYDIPGKPACGYESAVPTLDWGGAYIGGTGANLDGWLDDWPGPICDGSDDGPGIPAYGLAESTWDREAVNSGGAGAYRSGLIG